MEEQIAPVLDEQSLTPPAPPNDDREISPEKAYESYKPVLDHIQETFGETWKNFNQEEEKDGKTK